MNNPKRIFVVGHSGAGKGVLAQALAQKLGWQYIDADFALAPSIGKTIAEILGNEGQEKFQQCLTEILAQQKQLEQIVVTTDDSIVCDAKARQLLSSEFTVYLKVSPGIQLERIAHNRPLLARSDYQAFLNTLRSERDDLYAEVACFSLSSDNGAIDEHVVSVINAFT